MTPAAPPRSRDADRSRRRILDAAEELFSASGPDAVSLANIGRRAGVSRATPSYFFGTKDGVHRAVLERVFAERELATTEAFAPVTQWAAVPDGPLAPRLRDAVAAYLDFLAARPAFVRLVAWEGLSGGRQLRETPRASRAMHDAFSALSNRTRHGFDVDDAVLILVALTFTPLTQTDTLMARLSRDLHDPDVRSQHASLVAKQLLALVDVA